MNKFKRVMAHIGICVSILAGVFSALAVIIWTAAWFGYWVTTWPWPPI